MKKITLCGCLLAILLHTMSSCRETVTQETQPVEQNTTVSSAQTEEATANDILSYLPDMDFQGETFTFFGTSPENYFGYYVTDDICVDMLTGERMNDAYYQRTKDVENAYNIHIVMEPHKSVAGDIIKTVTAGDFACDAFFSYQNEMYSLALGKYLTDVQTVPYVDLLQPWWDANSVEEYMLFGKTYVVTGDISTAEDDSTRLVVFNKKLLSDYDLASPYQFVAENRWTIDAFTALTKAVSFDVDGNGVMEAGDVFGLMVEENMLNLLYYGIGGRYIENKQEDGFSIIVTEPKNFDRFDKILSLVSMKDCTSLTATWKDIGDFTNVYTYARSLFTQDKFLFHIACPLVFHEFRDMESEFGIVPLPKYDEAQERYYSPVDAVAPMLGIPSVVNSMEKTGLILEAMAMVSHVKVVPEYQEMLLKRKYTRDNDSAEMLDLIATSRKYCIEDITNFGNICSIFQSKYLQGQAVSVSDYEKIRKKAEAAIKKATDTFADVK